MSSETRQIVCDGDHQQRIKGDATLPFASDWGPHAAWATLSTQTHRSYQDLTERLAMLEATAWISLCVAFVCALIIVGDEFRHPQKMWVMNIVWPVTALYFSVVALWGYYRIGRRMAKNGMPHTGMSGELKGEAHRTVQIRPGSRR